MFPKTPNNIENTYYRDRGPVDNYVTGVGIRYDDNFYDMPPDTKVYEANKNTKKTTTQEESQESGGLIRKGRLSIFNRYSLFYYNSLSNSQMPENYLDSPNRLSDAQTLNGTKYNDVVSNPTAKNIINWSRQGGANGGTNAVEYDWEDFLWCKNYGTVPNNYLITLRRFSVPVNDDILDVNKQSTPDISRLIAWVDGESNKWESIGLKFTTSLEWKLLTSEIQTIQSDGYGSEANLIGKIGSVVPGKRESAAAVETIIKTGQISDRALKSPSGIDPYQNKNTVYGPIDIIKKMNIRESGIDFDQKLNIKFEYELKSIDGINTKVAMIDLLSNILICTTNRADFWGGESRFFSTNNRRATPFGNPSLLANGDPGGYFKSIVSGLGQGLNNLFGGAKIGEGGLKNLGGNLAAMAGNILGGLALNNIGRPEAQAINALLTGEDTGEWHVTVGNPANPIMTIGNLILKSTDIEFGGALGPDDFPTKLTVTCQLEPARPRDRTDILSMFHRNARTYLTMAPSGMSYAGNKETGGKNGGKVESANVNVINNERLINDSKLKSMLNRFPNHIGKEKESVLDNAAQGIY